MVRYSDTSFFGNLEESPIIYEWNPANITEPDRFMQLLGQTMNSLVDLAADAPKKFATKEVSFTNFDQFSSCHTATSAIASITASSSPPPGSVTRPDHGNNDQISPLTIVAIVVPIAVVLFLVGCIFLKRKTRKKYDAVQEQNGNMHEITTVESLQFDLATIEAATNRFSVNNKLGGGGFGEVYKVTVI
ncbi:PREDICTED: cysteine-rich receptor-like protein kinase 25-like [Fragaria vesca subsp. vesca]